LTGCATLPRRPPAPPTEIEKTEETDNRRRIIVIPADQLERARSAVPIADDVRSLGPADPAGETLRVATRQVQVEWLRESGIEILEETANTPRRYFDESFQSREGRPPPRDEDGGLITDDGFKDAAMTEALLRAFAETYPEITRLHEIGRTLEGRPMLALLITDNPDEQEDEPAHLFIAAHHGSELLSTEPVWDTVEYLTERYSTDSQVRAWVDENEIWCMPVVNLDGLHRHWHFADATGRRNARDTDGDGDVPASDGVDLNRNYPFLWRRGGKRASTGEPGTTYYRGPLPGSEPETQAVMHLANAQRFVTMISYHTTASRVLVPYSIDKALNPHPSAAWAMAREIGPLIESHRPNRPYQIVRHLYPVDGTDQDWHLFAHGTQAYLVELPRGNQDYETHRGPVCEGIRPMWMYLLDRLPRGPSLSGNVVDAATGEPLEAYVRLEEILWSHGEVHTSHPETGRFDRILPGPGTYHVRVEQPGYESEVVEVEVGEREWRRVEIALRSVESGS
jgi:hypothetical protein